MQASKSNTAPESLLIIFLKEINQPTGRKTF